jgi:hypothetical protein
MILSACKSTVNKLAEVRQWVCGNLRGVCRKYNWCTCNKWIKQSWILNRLLLTDEGLSWDVILDRLLLANKRLLLLNAGSLSYEAVLVLE